MPLCRNVTYSIGHVSVHTQFTSLAVTLTGHDWLNQDHLQEKAFLKKTIIQKIQLMKNLQKTESLSHFLKINLEEAILELMETKPINPQSLFLDVSES